MIDTTTSTRADERSTAQLVQQLTEQASTLIKQEIRLAQLELASKAKQAGIGIGALGGAGFLALYAVGVLLAAAVLGLATVFIAWLAALIVAGALLLVIAVLALLGKRKLGKIGPAAPVQALASAKLDLDTVKKAAKR